ncbi:MAG TPA: hypothetical protein VM076_25490 [Gemmatimonadaceae bacterium]|nr:hypothetical protein [Gemmatimonadaceae bacterium]
MPAVAAAQSAATPITLPPLHLESLAIDPVRNRLVLFGGAAELTGTLEWNGDDWRRTVDSASSPFPRAGAAMTWEPVRRAVVMFGGQPRRAPNAPSALCDTWAYDGRWTRLHDGACVTDRMINSSLVYDSWDGAHWGWRLRSRP